MIKICASSLLKEKNVRQFKRELSYSMTKFHIRLEISLILFFFGNITIKIFKHTKVQKK